MLNELCDDILLYHIFPHVEISIFQVCKRFYTLSKNEKLWELKCILIYGIQKCKNTWLETYKYLYKLENIPVYLNGDICKYLKYDYKDIQVCLYQLEYFKPVTILFLTQFRILFRVSLYAGKQISDTFVSTNQHKFKGVKKIILMPYGSLEDITSLIYSPKSKFPIYGMYMSGELYIVNLYNNKPFEYQKVSNLDRSTLQVLGLNKKDYFLEDKVYKMLNDIGHLFIGDS